MFIFPLIVFAWLIFLIVSAVSKKEELIELKRKLKEDNKKITLIDKSEAMEIVTQFLKHIFLFFK